MTYVIAEPCIGVLDRACVEGQPVASPGVATKIGRLGVDTELVAAHPPLSR